jgi:carbon-monoxide dehydrogenase medium subunit
MLLALDATVSLRSAAGERTLPLSGFFRDVFETALAPGELLCRIVVPAVPAGARATYVKFLPRTQDDYATVSVAVVLAVDGRGKCSHARIALGAVGPTAFRAMAAERSLVGRPLTSAVAAEAAELAAEAADPIDDVRGSATYKRQMARVWTRRAIESLASSEA